MKKHALRFGLFYIAAAFLLTGCGFQPLYGPTAQNRPAVSAHLNQIEIANIPEREGQYLRNILMDRFYQTGRPGQPLYILTIAPIDEQLRDLDITKSSDATRAQLRLNTAVVLRDAQSGESLLERKLSAITSFNILKSQFTTRVSEENTRLNALQNLAAQIENQLALYFSRTES